MLVVIPSTPPLPNSSGLSRASFCWLCSNVFGREIAFRAAHCVNRFAKGLPRCGVPIVMTRRTEALGPKKN